MPDDIDLRFHTNFGEDFSNLRKMLYKIEDLKDLVPEWNEHEAEEIHDEILELARTMIDATAKGKDSPKT